ncbi:MAG TPA: type II toxin-antitoxin system ParD family antitoxin [Rhizomicrobium sp.]|jgi:antitoxin ParD1/3/4
MPRTSRPLTVTLGELQASVDRRVQSGAYASASEVLRDAIRALDREDAALDIWLQHRIQELEANPGIPPEEVFEGLRQRDEVKGKKGRKGA